MKRYFCEKGRVSLSRSSNPEWNLTEYFETIAKTNNILKAAEDKDWWKQLPVKNERKQFFHQFENIFHASVMPKNLPVRWVVKYCLKAIFLRYVREIADVNFTFLKSQKR